MKKRRRKHEPEFCRNSCFFPWAEKNHSQPTNLSEWRPVQPPNRERALTKRPKSDAQTTFASQSSGSHADSIALVCRRKGSRFCYCIRRRRRRTRPRRRQQGEDERVAVSCHYPATTKRRQKIALALASNREQWLQLTVCLWLIYLVCSQVGAVPAEFTAGKTKGNLTTCSRTQLCNDPVRETRSANGARAAPSISVNTRHGVFRGLILSDRLHWQQQQQQQQQRTRGQTDVDKVVAFLGIRYASAPVKRLRFMPPTPFRHAANQMHEATKLGPICMQRWPVDLDKLAGALSELHQAGDQVRSGFSSASAEDTQNPAKEAADIKLALLAKTMSSVSFNYLRPLFRRLIAREQSEDCLNLNIYVPLQVLQEEQEAKLPVLVIIHGESFDYGAGSAYDGHKLLLHSGAQMLVVTFNYRLNVFGFLPKLPGASRGNLGLMDQIAALHWIKDNIGSFGGSASNITLMGTKKAALFVNLLMLSPMAKAGISFKFQVAKLIILSHRRSGLFHRAIMEDGSALSPITANQVAPHYQHSNSVQYLRILAKLCDCPASPASGSQSSRVLDGGQSSVDDAKTNAQMLDCLRNKPANQIGQRVPLELLQLDPNSGELVLEQRWHNKVRPILPTAGMSVKSEQLARIVNQVTSQEAVRKHPAMSDPLFEAIYGHTNQAAGGSTVRPLFGPLIDGSIVPEEDFALNMLKEDSNLAQRDLLIGLTHPVLFQFRDESATSRNGTSSSSLSSSSSTLNELPADNYLSDRILANQELNGLSNEQAINLVNAFVRSFYRYHNQEIANSILNHYLSLAASNVWQQQQSETARQQTDMRHRSSSPNEIIADQHDEEAKLHRRRQDFLLGSISRLFRDSLTDVPLFKLALIHSVKQVDPLVGAFVDKLFDQWKAEPRHLADEQDSFAAESERKSLLESFTAFARHQLDGHESRPLKWRPLSTGPQTTNIKSTFLYQFDASTTSNRPVEAAIERILEREKATEQENIWKLISPILRDLASKLHSVQLRRASLECAHYPSAGDDMDVDLLARLEEWFCSRRIRRILAGFIVAGDVNAADESEAAVDSIEENLAIVESKCSPKASPSNDHHSVQPFQGDSLNSQTNESDDREPESVECREHLSNIALTVLTNELKQSGGASRGQTRSLWTNFNIFSQQIATLTNQEPAKLWRMNRISEFSNEPGSLVSKSSFWSNFIPALNCNKTQPITPSALLDGSFNSSLLNLSLQYTCQHGTRSAQDYIESIVSLAGQRLQARKSQWRLSSAQPPSLGQNHHSLRMANMSQSNSADENLDANDEHNSNVSQANLNLSSAPNDNEPNSRTNPKDFAANKATGFILVLCALIVGVTLVSGTYVVIKQRGHRAPDERISAKQGLSSQVASQTHTALGCSPQDLTFQLLDQSAAEHQSISAAATTDMMAPLEGGGANSRATSADWETIRSQDRSSALQTTIANGDENPDARNPYSSDLANHSFSGLNQPCRSHSAMSLAAHLQPVDSFVDVGAFNLGIEQPFSGYGLGFDIQEQPIVLPILSNANYQQELRCQTLNNRRHNCQPTFDNQSSTETQNGRSSQSSNVAATMKKRVKINDPQSIMRASNGRRHNDTYGRVSQQHNNQQQIVYQDKSRVQLCPIHSRSQSSQYLSALDAGYILNGTNEYLTINNPETWTSVQVAATTSNDHNNQCDHFPSSIGEPMVENQAAKCN